MKLNSKTFRTVDEVIADVAFSVGDPDIRIRTLGWYRARVKRAIQNLAIQSEYYRRYADIVIPDTRIVPLPDDFKTIHAAWGIKLDGSGNVESTQLCYPKEALYAGTKTYTSRNNPNALKDYHTSPTVIQDSSLLFYTQDAGNLILSEASDSFDKLRLDYSGYGHDITTVGDAAIIPLEATDAVEGYVAVMYHKSRMGENPNLRPMYAQAMNDLYSPMEGRMSLWDMTKRQLTTSSPDEMQLAMHNWRR